MTIRILPGVALALCLALLGQYLSDFIGITLMGLPKSPVSAIMLAILLGIVVSNTVRLPDLVQPGIKFGLVRILRIGIVLLGIRLSLAEAGSIGLQSLPIIIGAVATALIVVTYFGKRMGLSGRLGVLIAGGTSICGATAIVAIAPAVKAKDNEVSYAVACITLFGVVAMLAYPFLGHWIFDGDAIAAGLFLGTSVHETAQVAGAGLVYQQFYNSPQALDFATVTKLVRNLGMLVVIPLMSIIYVRSTAEAAEAPKWYSMIPLFVVGFAAMSLIRTVGDSGEMAFGVLPQEQWSVIVSYTKHAAEICLAVAMAAVGLGTSLRGLKSIGLRPLAVGLFSALLVGAVSVVLITVLHG
ncbi:MAG: putative sulfate exporter family transporter [Pseudomonadota bacterium]